MAMVFLDVSTYPYHSSRLILINHSNVPIGGVVFAGIIFALTLTGLDETTRKLPLSTKARKLDLPGIVLLIAAVSCLFLALQEGGVKVPWNHAKPIGLLVGFVLIFIIFGLWQWKAGEDATVPLRYLKDRTVIWGSLYLFWDNMASYIVSQLRTLLDMC
jgi:hypothetical protein